MMVFRRRINLIQHAIIRQSTATGDSLNYIRASIPSTVRSITDGFIIIDNYGERFKYHSAINSWINIGSRINTQLVNTNNDGLVSPELSDFIESIINTNYTFFKINKSDAYWLYLKSQFNDFIFNINNNAINIEINRNKIVDRLLRSACQGKKGLKGEKGSEGEPGIAGSLEDIISVSIDNNILEFESQVSTEIDTAISIRLIQDNINLVEILYDFESDNIVYNVSNLFGKNIDVDNSIVKLDELLYVKIILDSNWEGEWIAKARQRGPKGRKGIDGDPFIKIKNFAYKDPNLRSTSVISTIRNVGYSLISSTNNNITDWPISKLRAHQDSINDFEHVSDVNDIIMASVRPSTSNKSIFRWVFDKELPAVNELDLPTWVPDPSCYTGDQVYSFRWMDNIESNECELKIKVPSQIPNKCCQEDFFFCPNALSEDASEDGNDCGIKPAGQGDAGGGLLPG